MKRAIWLCGLFALVAAGCSNDDEPGLQGPGAVDIEKTLIELVRSEGVPANGNDAAIIRVVARDKDGRTIPNRSVEARSSNPADTVTYAPDDGRTDSQGATEIHVRATTVGTRVITITVQGLTMPQRPTVDFVFGSGEVLEFVDVPTVGKAGRPLRPAVRVEVRDDQGNRVMDANAEIELRVGTASTYKVQAEQGVATFSNVVIEEPGNHHRLVASGPGMQEVESDPIEIIVGDPARLTFQREPENVEVGKPFAVSVQVRDAADNVVVNSNDEIRLRLYSNPTGTTLEGTIVAQAQEGIATFDDLVIREGATGYVIAAAAGGYESALTNSFSVTAGGASQELSTLTVRPVDPSRTDPIAIANDHDRLQIDARIVDAEGNPLVGRPITITATGSDHTFHPTPEGEDGRTFSTITTASGKVTAWISSRKAEPKTITLRVGDLFDLTADVIFEPDVVSPVYSSLVPEAVTAIVDIEEDTAPSAGIRFEVLVHDAFDNPIPETTVQVAATGNGNILDGVSGTTVTTDDKGIATFRLRSSRAEMKTVSVRMGSVTLEHEVEFFPGAPSRLRSGIDDKTINQDTTVNTAVDNDFVVVVRDRYSNVIEGATVDFAIVDPRPGAALSTEQTTTDEFGRASTRLTVGIESGEYEVSWHAGWDEAEVHEQLLTAYGTPDVPQSIVLTAPSGDISGVAGGSVSLSFQVKDEFGNITGGDGGPNAKLSFSGDGEPPAEEILPPWAKGSEPTVTVSWTLGEAAGTNNLQVSMPNPKGGPDITFDVQAEGKVGQPAVLEVLSTNTEFDGLLVTESLDPDVFAFRVYDSNENIVEGAEIRLTITPFTTDAESGAVGGATGGVTDISTDVQGLASTTYTAGTKSGTKTINVQLLGAVNPDSSDAKATFTVHVIPDKPALLTHESGDGEDGTVGTVIGTELAVKVTDQYENVLEGVPVTFTVGDVDGPGSGLGDDAEPSVEPVTNAQGIASTTFKLGQKPGTYEVIATSTDPDLAGKEVPFTLTAEAGAPARVTIKSGEVQPDLVVGGALTNRLEVEVADEFDNLLEDQTVVFSGTTGVQFDTDPSVQTNNLGLASIGVTALPELVGDVSVTATAGSESATFEWTTVPDVPAEIEYVSGDGQTGTVGMTLDDPLEAKVTDRFTNPTPNAKVNFRTLFIVAGEFIDPADEDVTGNPLSVFTDSEGVASVYWKLPNTPSGFDSYIATAEIDGLPPGNGPRFNADAEVGPPDKLEITLSEADGKQTVGGSITVDVVVRDHVDNPLDGETVDFIVASNTAGRSATPSSMVTAGGGKASTEIAVGTEVGTFDLEIAVGTTVVEIVELEALVGPPHELVITGNGQEGTVGQALDDAITVQVVDEYGNPISGVTVDFAGDGSFDPASDDTGDEGTVSTAWTLGTSAGAQNATVSAAGLVENLTANAKAGEPASIAKEKGDNETVVVGGQIVLEVKVEDAHGNSVDEGDVLFEVVAGTSEANFGGNPSISVPLAAGFAEATVDVGNSATSFQVTATAGTQVTTFELTAEADAPNEIVVIAGNNQTGGAGLALLQSIVVKLVDVHGNPIEGETIDFEPENAGEGSFDPASPTTGADGTAETVWTLHDVPGAYNATASFGTIVANLSATADPVAFVEKTMGDGEAATVGGTITLEVQVSDINSNLLDDVEVTFEVAAGTSEANFGGDSSVAVNTDADGKAQAVVSVGTHATDFQVIATAGTIVAVFNLEAEADVPDDLLLVSGDGQEGTVGEALADAIVVRLVDQYLNPIEGETVDFAPLNAGEGSFDPASPVTGADGTAQTVWTLHTVPGNYDATASFGAFSVPLTATAKVGDPANITMITVERSGEVDSILELEVEVTDAVGNKLDGVDVNFAIVSDLADATVDGLPMVDVQTTLGLAEVTLGFGTKATDFQLVVTAQDASETFDFDTLAGTAAKIFADSGDNQEGFAGIDLEEPLVVRVTDLHDNPVEGATVNFTTTGAGVFGNATDDSDAEGLVSTTFQPVVGSNEVTASLDADPTVEVSFTLTGLEPPSSFEAIAGDLQRINTDELFGNPVVVRILDQNDDPIEGVKVSFSATGGSIEGESDPTTNEEGYAIATVRAGLVEGDVTVTASIDGDFGLADVDFDLFAEDSLLCQAAGAVTYYESAGDLVSRDWADGAGTFLMGQDGVAGFSLWVEFAEAVTDEPDFGFVHPSLAADCDGTVVEVAGVANGPAELSIDGTLFDWTDPLPPDVIADYDTATGFFTIGCEGAVEDLTLSAIDDEVGHFTRVLASGEPTGSLCDDPPQVVPPTP